MKFSPVAAIALLLNFSLTVSAQTSHPGGRTLFLDMHQLTPGKINMKDVAEAQVKDLGVQKKYGVDILKYWIDEKRGQVFCLASAPDASSLKQTHAEAHGLIPSNIYPVTEGEEANLKGGKALFLDIHELGAGNVSAAAVADAHRKDLAVQKKYGVNLINYWVDEKDGIVMCLAQAKDSASLVKTHKEAHGLIPVRVMKVKQGQ